MKNIKSRLEHLEALLNLSEEEERARGGASDLILEAIRRSKRPGGSAATEDGVRNTTDRDSGPLGPPDESILEELRRSRDAAIREDGEEEGR